METTKKQKQAKEVNAEVIRENLATASIEELSQLPFELKEENVYSATAPEKPEDEQVIIEGMDILKAEFGISSTLHIIGKHWNDRPVFRRAVELIKEEAAKTGKTYDDYLNEVLRPEVEKLDKMQKGLSRLKYALNYMKSRPGKEKDSISPIKMLDGTQRMISLRTFTKLKADYEQHKDKDRFTAEIIANSTESATLTL